MKKKFFQHKKDAMMAIRAYTVWAVSWIGMLFLHIKMKNENNISAIAPLFLCLMFLIVGFIFLVRVLPKYAFNRIEFSVYGIDIIKPFDRAHYNWENIKGTGKDCWTRRRNDEIIRMPKIILYAKTHHNENFMCIAMDKKPEIEKCISLYYKSELYNFDETQTGILQ